MNLLSFLEISYIRKDDEYLKLAGIPDIVDINNYMLGCQFSIVFRLACTSEFLLSHQSFRCGQSYELP